MNFLHFIRASAKIILLQALLLSVSVMHAFCGNGASAYKDSTHSTKIKKAKPIIMGNYLQVFYPLDNTAEYSITICADLPDNSNPKCVYKKGEPGHVFLVLSKQNNVTPEAVVIRSFGFYPRLPVTCLIKQVRSEILDNSDREYDVSLEKKLSKEEFALLLEKCIEFSKKKYNLKRYNCYEYVMEVFNSLPGIETLPVSKVKFPFIFGRGGSPCGLYGDLKKLLLSGSSWVPYIKFGTFKSPALDRSQNLIANF
ncbi:MAG: hypothetical protein ABJA37_08725 [Ferruginibacter sp.]